MAIKRKDTAAAAPALPAEFSTHARKAFSLQVIGQKYEEAFKDEKAWLANFLETTDQITVDLGKGIRTTEGLVCYKGRDNWKIDTAKIEAMVKAGELSLATVLAIATINAGKLKTAIGEVRFNGLAVNEPSEHLALTATPEFKAEMDELFGEVNAGHAGMPKDLTTPLSKDPVLAAAMAGDPAADKLLGERSRVEFPEPAPAARSFGKPKVDPFTKKVTPATDVKASLAKAKAASAKAKAPAAPDADLDAILKEKNL